MSVHLFDTEWMEDRYPPRFRNEDRPDAIPRQNQGEIAVIVRVIEQDGAEKWRPAEARRWTSTHVMVAFRLATERRREKLGWFRAEDVVREIPGPLVPPRPNH